QGSGERSAGLNVVVADLGKVASESCLKSITNRIGALLTFKRSVESYGDSNRLAGINGRLETDLAVICRPCNLFTVDRHSLDRVGAAFPLSDLEPFRFSEMIAEFNVQSVNLDLYWVIRRLPLAVGAANRIA